MIRQTRGEIEKYYSDDLQTPFPKLGTPEAVDYSFDAATEAVFRQTVTAIKNFHYARYTPSNYLPEKYSAARTAQQNLKGFMKSILLKRPESSFFAFRKNLERFVKSYENFLDMFEHGTVYISKKVDVYKLPDDEEILLELIERGVAEKISSDEFSPNFKRDLLNDLTLLKNLLHDDKNFSCKKIIFTEPKETAEYLFDALTKIFGDKIILFTGDSSRSLKIERNFDPQSARPEKHLPPEERILEKLQIFHSALGEDFKYISEAEEVAPKKLFSVLNASFDADEVNPETKYLKLIRKTRDTDKKIFERIKNLPQRARAGKFSDKIHGEATLSFMRRGELKNFYLHGDVTENLSFVDAIKFLECTPDEKSAPVGEKFFEQYDANVKAFETLSGNFDAQTAVAASKSDKIFALLKVLRNVVTEDERKIILSCNLREGNRI